MKLPPVTPQMSPQFTQAVQTLRASIKTVSQEAVTGRHSDLTRQLDGRIGVALLSQRAVTDIADERLQLTTRATRLEITQQALSRVRGGVETLPVRLLSAVGIGDQATQAQVASDARSSLSDVFSALNARSGERFLFSGDATATQPLGDASVLISDIEALAASSTTSAQFETALDTYFNDPAGPWQQTIYAGTPASSDPDAVIATDPALTAIVRGLAVISLADPATQPAVLSQPDTSLRAAAAQLSDGHDALVTLQADRGRIEARIQDQFAALDTRETVLTEAFNKLTARDPYEAATQLRELENSLEASYLLTTRLANLTLLNFLR